MPTYQKCAEALLWVRQSIILSLIHVLYNAKVIMIICVGIESLVLEMKKLSSETLNSLSEVTQLESHLSRESGFNTCSV